MRTIDADALKRSLFDIVEPSGIIYASDAESLIENAPTIAQEVYITGGQWDIIFKEMRKLKRPTGHWIDKYKTHIAYKCSCCGIEMPISDYFNFCPKCGAKMAKEAENE